MKLFGALLISFAFDVSFSSSDAFGKSSDDEAEIAWKKLYVSEPVPSNWMDLGDEFIYQVRSNVSYVNGNLCEREVADVRLPKSGGKKNQHSARKYVELTTVTEEGCDDDKSKWVAFKTVLPPETLETLVPYVLKGLTENIDIFYPTNSEWRDIVSVRLSKYPFAFVQIIKPDSEKPATFGLTFCNGFGLQCWGDQLILGLRPSPTGYGVEPNLIVVE